MATAVSSRSRSPLVLLKRYRTNPVVQALEAGYYRAVWERDRFIRTRKHRDFDTSATHPVVADLERDGVAVMRNAVDPALVHALAEQLDARCKAGERLHAVVNDRVRRPGDLAEATQYVDPAEVAKGEDHLRDLTNYISVSEPFVDCPASVPLAFDDLLIDIATGYLRCPPAIGGVNLRKSFVNDLTEFDTLHFHSDPNSPKFLKFFFYLNDVDADGGPFAYVRGTHRRKFRGWRRKYRWTPEEIESIYGRDRLFFATANVGDLVIADTTGFHRGTKVRSRDRSMLTVNYVVHREFRGRQVGFKLPRPAAQGLSPRASVLVDFLDIVDGSK